MQPQAQTVLDLTTGRAPFIEEARSRGDLFIPQPFELYSEQNHETWRRLYERMQPCWERYANRCFLDGLQVLQLDAGRIPRLDEINRVLAPLTGFRARAVSGYVPAFLFFDCLWRREFPTTVTMRPLESLDYLPEPDIFHDVAGHVPMHTDPAFAAALVRFGECAHTAAGIACSIHDEATRLARMTSIIKAMARFFWFTVEFGLMQTADGLRAFGSGLLSSHAELAHAIESPEVQRSPASLDWLIHQSFEIDHFQPLLFSVDSFEQLYDLTGKLEEWMLAGKLDHVAPGEPSVSAEDLRSFLQAPAS